jgi:RNA recognition motif-containing protein
MQAFCASTRYRLEELDDAGHLHSGKKHRQPHELPVSDYPGAIWVGNVPVHAIERDIARVFAAYGEIAKVEMPRPRFGENHDSEYSPQDHNNCTNARQGDIKYAYVYFRYPEAAHRAQRGHVGKPIAPPTSLLISPRRLSLVVF